MEYKRKLNLEKLIKTKSYFLFGPRSTGKTFWLKKCLKNQAFFVNLLESKVFLRLSESPWQLSEMINQSGHTKIVIDEIQKLPILLDEVHNLIEEKKLTFLLTGSSARRLKRENANMLGGRAANIDFYPLSYSEITDFNLEKYLQFGGLPRIYLSDDKELELDAYVKNYLEQEIKYEANVRNLAPFSRFLKSACLNNGNLINFTNISNDSGVPASTVREYYTLLQDSLLGYSLEPWLESKKRKAIQTAKFYLFDPGIVNYLLDIKTIDRNSNNWGLLFEQFIGMELKAYFSYTQTNKKLTFWRNTSKHEVDYIVGNEIAVEVKATKKVESKHLKGLYALKEENIVKDYYLISEDKIERRTSDGFQLLYWQNFLDKLWKNEIV